MSEAKAPRPVVVVLRRIVSSKELREVVGLLAVVASLVFVGLQIRQSNIQARAAAYQAIGIATSQYLRP